MFARNRRTSYRGPERRRNRVYRTHNSEYLCRDGICVAVRDVASGDYLPAHPALGMRMTGGIRFTRDGTVESFSVPGELPHVGESLYFSDGSPDFTVRTSALERIERPSDDALPRFRG
jgi:hypothetical protein